MGAQLYLGHTHVLLFICTSGIVYTNMYSTSTAVQDVKVLETWDSWASHRHNQKIAPTLGPTTALVVPMLTSN